MLAFLKNIFFIARSGLLWFFSLMIVLSTLADLISTSDFHIHGLEIIPITLGILASVIAFSHLCRVKLIAQEVNWTTLANRHRRHVDIPLETNEAFALLEAAVKELPNVKCVESAPDSLQIRAKIKHVEPYDHQFLNKVKCLSWLTNGTNQLLATVTPHNDMGSVTLICEPDRAVWTDWFLVDNGTNLANMEAMSRTISRRVAQSRKMEKEIAQKNVMEKELTAAKLNLLHAQVEPHFLYNTLASAQLLTRSDPASADHMLGNLITYLRHSLPKTEDSLSTIGDELERAKAYLDIMAIRMGNRLQLQVEMPTHLRPVLFPSMMLQTLVENAIKHGLEPKSGGGTIWILARAHEDTVSVTVADDGRGLSIEGSGTGIGLRNVRERLRLIYGNYAQLSIVANFPSGVAATITVPMHFLQGEKNA